MSLDSMTIGTVVGFTCSVGFLALGYTLGAHSVDDKAENDTESRNEVIDKLVATLEEMKGVNE